MKRSNNNKQHTILSCVADEKHKHLRRLASKISRSPTRPAYRSPRRERKALLVRFHATVISLFWLKKILSFLVFILIYWCTTI